MILISSLYANYNLLTRANNPLIVSNKHEQQKVFNKQEDSLVII